MTDKGPGQESGTEEEQVEGQVSTTQGDGKTSTTTSESGSTTTNTKTQVLPTEAPKEDDEAAWSSLPKWVRDIRKDAAANRVAKNSLETEKKTLQDKVTAFEEADLTDQQKELSRLKKLEDEKVPELTKRNRELEVQLAATQLDVHDPEVVSKLIDWAEIEKGSKVKDVIEDLLKKHPYLKKSGTSEKEDDGEEEEEATGTGKKPAKKVSPANPASQNGKPVFTREKLKDMPEEEINKLFEDGTLTEAMTDGRIKKS